MAKQIILEFETLIYFFQIRIYRIEVDFWNGQKKSSNVFYPTQDRFLSVMDGNLSVTVRNKGNGAAFEIALTVSGYSP